MDKIYEIIIICIKGELFWGDLERITPTIVTIKLKIVTRSFKVIVNITIVVSFLKNNIEQACLYYIICIIFFIILRKVIFLIFVLKYI